MHISKIYKKLTASHMHNEYATMMTSKVTMPPLTIVPHSKRIMRKPIVKEAESAPVSELEHLDAHTRDQLVKNFEMGVKGYHLVNDDPIKETPWEAINADILNASGCAVTTQSNGSHKPGADINCSLGGFSNKSTQYDKGFTSFKISSYRLTTVCSDKTPGKVEDIIAEINRRKDFAYYSIIVREETDETIHYAWYLIPCDYYALNPSSYTWTPKLGKLGKNKDAITGWETNTLNGSSMSISFSMSSQLWINVSVTDELKKFIIGTCTVTKGRKHNYLDLYAMFNNNTVSTV